MERRQAKGEETRKYSCLATRCKLRGPGAGAECVTHSERRQYEWMLERERSPSVAGAKVGEDSDAGRGSVGVDELALAVPWIRRAASLSLRHGTLSQKNLLIDLV